MKKPLSLILGLLALAAAATFLLGAQTGGSNAGFNSKTWKWTGLTSDLPQTTLFTPATNGDFIVSAYVTIDPNQPQSGLCVTPKIQYTDEYGTQQGLFVFANSVYTNVGSGSSGATITIHTLANTSVGVSVQENGCGGTSTGTYDLVIGMFRIGQ